MDRVVLGSFALAFLSAAVWALWEARIADACILLAVTCFFALATFAKTAPNEAAVESPPSIAVAEAPLEPQPRAPHPVAEYTPAERTEMDRMRANKARRKIGPKVESTFEKILACGMKLRDGVSATDVLDRAYRADGSHLNDDTALALLSQLAEEDENGEVYLSDDVRHFDTECIYAVGDYTCFVNSLVQLAGADLPISNVRDTLTTSESGDGISARIDFLLDGQLEHLTLVSERDWIDESIFSRLNELLARRGVARRIAVMSLGQDGLAVCRTLAEIAKLNRIPGLMFEVPSDDPMP